MVKNIFWYIWEFPQNIAGLIVLYANRKQIKSYEIIHNRLFIEVRSFGVSLGRYVFWSYRNNGSNKQHEFGHSVQSRIFGPLYLLIIGIPSLLRVFYSFLFYQINGQPWPDYFKGYPENWADKLGAKHFSNTNR